MTVEPFTAIAECPECGSIAVHLFRMPRERPANYERTRIVMLGMPDAYAAEEAATVMRQCVCGNEWPQI